MTQLVELASSKTLTMSSLEIAELTGKEHFHVLRDIRNMLAEIHGEEGVSKFGDTHINPQNKQSYQIFRLPKRETMVLVSGYSIKMRTAIVDRWLELEDAAKQSVVQIPNFEDPIEAALAWVEAKKGERAALLKVENLTGELTVAKGRIEYARPRVRFCHAFVEAEGSYGFRQVAKILEAAEPDLRDFLISNGIMYRLDGKLTAKAEHLEAGRFITKVGLTEGGRAFTQTKLTPKGLEWLAGKWLAYCRLNKKAH